MPLRAETLLGLGEAGEGTAYFFLVDCSTSIYQSDMDGIKQMLASFATDRGNLDRLVLIAFGERVDVVLDGSEDVQTAVERIDGLAPNQNTTLFNDAVVKALDLAEAQQGGLPDHKVIVVISDGINYDEAAGRTEQEVLDRLDAASVPLYALCLPSADFGANPQAFGQLARKSGGDIRMADGSTVAAEFAGLNSHITAIKVLTLLASSNIIEAPEQHLAISITLGDRVITTGGIRTITVNAHVPDTIPPSITKVEQLDESRVKVFFSEAVDNAAFASSYVIRDSDNQALTIQSVTYSESDGTATAEVVLEGKPYSGEYTLEAAGVTDHSMEKNAVDNLATFEFEGQPVVYKYLRMIVFDYWWVLLLMVIIVILLIVFRALRRRKGLVKVDGKISFGDAVEFKHHFETPKTRSIRLLVIDAKGMGTQVDLDAESSVFIGRAKSNTLSFDDTKMSRQHFVIEAADEGFFVTDLESANGTFVNNDRLKEKRLLQEGDTITAGHEKLVYQGFGSASAATQVDVRGGK
ncbi:MAG: FHA domain-containing protein [Coriobacteriales bacterium]|jgi:preprotein translocase subunit YajC|nr:FHA domain-containing protein [Coriobacteriales bacterium]